MIRTSVRQHSLTFRLTTLFALTSVLVLAGLGLFIASAIEKHFDAQDDQLLHNELQLIRTLVQEKRTQSIPDIVGQALRTHPGFYVDIRETDGHLIYSTLGHARSSIVFETALHAAGSPFAVSVDGNHAFRAIQAEIIRPEASKPLRVLIAVDTDIHAHFFHDFLITLMLYTAAAALLTIILGWWVARQGLAPLRAMAIKAQVITAQNFDERMPVDAMPAEMADLAQRLNAMLERLQQDFMRLTEFSTDLAHELRTPISNLLTQSQVVLTQDRSAQAYRDVIASYSEELQRLARMISDMLFLAQTENGITLPNTERLNLETEVKNIFDFYDAMAEEKQVKLLCIGTGVIQGDRLMLRRALNNLLSNALRYTPSGGHITVRIEHDAQEIRLCVDNEGNDISPEVLPHLFDRFFRADKSRAHLESGSAGLGLAITRAIVQAHNGVVSVTSQDGRTTFTLCFSAKRDSLSGLRE
ncbi:heavy metal sensor histidine kinase [Bordetella sp. FB-8]|uniref:heavy metal sensor histidine kinase n=1 Tax=Bordetella sp. FB-8 TaxID=1159870 RepID=UPI000362B45A|nr:heavy metal sensor histidine kinase [Bordetella sp. FB-8]